MVAGLAGVMTGAAMLERRAMARWARNDDRAGAASGGSSGPRPLNRTSRVVTTDDGARLAVTQFGPSDAPRTAVLAHGFTGRSAHWDPIVERLVDAGLAVVAYDQRGHGVSSVGAEGFTMSVLGDDLAAVLRAEAPESAVVVGHSMGGVSIQVLFAREPKLASKVGSIVLVASLSRSGGSPLGHLIGRLAGTPLARRAMGHPRHGTVLVRSGFGQAPALAQLDVVRSGWAVCPDETRRGFARALSHFDLTSTLATMDVPALVICGDQDQVTPLEESRRMAELLPQGRLEIARGAGHEVTLERPDWVAGLIVSMTDPSRAVLDLRER
jgi:non-heme chloroperoxidase